ncbi:hypothetical protein ACFV3R_25305 [Streptomyces sp. NPDC059740]|uniref:hypothetical protein n=1 Tax=Streptomyces sp. NPDC059740 TaxID=3346926 RepID=UPI00364AE0EA
MPASKAKQAQTAKRRADAIRLRLAGMDYETIAERLGYASRGAASKDLCRAFDAFRAEEEAAVETWREIEAQRLDRLQAAAWPAAAKGDLKAIETVLKVIAQRCKLLGLDAPVRTELSGPDGGAIPLGGGTLDELHTLISITGSSDDAGLAPSDEGNSETSTGE